MDNTFLGLPLDLVWLPILIGLVMGVICPLRPFMRSKLHFTIKPNDEITLRKMPMLYPRLFLTRAKISLLAFVTY